jgi:hypothetical protein
MSEKASGLQIPTHPFFRSNSEESAKGAVSFVGYIGPASANNVVPIYASLEDLSTSVEVATADIIHVEDVPETTMPYGAKRVWLRGSANVVRRHTAKAENATTRDRRAMTEIRKGRLRMVPRVQVADPAVVRGDCNCVDCQNCISNPCFSPCSRCDPCYSECGSVPQ